MFDGQSCHVWHPILEHAFASCVHSKVQATVLHFFSENGAFAVFSVNKHLSEKVIKFQTLKNLGEIVNSYLTSILLAVTALWGSQWGQWKPNNKFLLSTALAMINLLRKKQWGQSGVLKLAGQFLGKSVRVLSQERVLTLGTTNQRHK